MKKFIFDFFRFYPVTGSIGDTIKLIRSGRAKKETQVRLFGKTKIKLRRKSTDLNVLESAFIHKHHRSPFYLGASPVIIDLGSNIGLTLLDYHYEYPQARLIGVEMDAENFKLLQFNTSTVKNCEIVNAGIWKENGEINYSGADSQSFSITAGNTTGENKTRAITIDRLLDSYNVSRVDFLKMDIEGAEAQIFLESDFNKWASRVNILSIEVHGAGNFTSETVFEKISYCLRQAGFTVFKSSAHWSSLIAFKTIIQ
ncbi:MAG: FkbM family methyltransferase [Bacteroidetes bacterium]|nr:FkbM family methyltransferase [Bacteroidota bacterium]